MLDKPELEQVEPEDEEQVQQPTTEPDIAIASAVTRVAHIGGSANDIAGVAAGRSSGLPAKTGLRRSAIDVCVPEADVRFAAPLLPYPAKAGRFLAIGALNGEIIVAVVFRPLGSEAVSVISMRPASRKERSL